MTLRTVYNPQAGPVAVDDEGRTVPSLGYGTADTLLDRVKGELAAGRLLLVDEPADSDDPVSPTAAAAFAETERRRERLDVLRQLDRDVLAHFVVDQGIDVDTTSKPAMVAALTPLQVALPEPAQPEYTPPPDGPPEGENMAHTPAPEPDASAVAEAEPDTGDDAPGLETPPAKPAVSRRRSHGGTR